MRESIGKHRAMRRAGYALTALGFGWWLYSVIYDSGLVALLADLQMRWMGSVSQKFIATLSCLVTIAPGLTIASIGQGRLRSAMGEAEFQASDPAARLERFLQPPVVEGSFGRRLVKAFGIMALVLGGFAALGAFFFLREGSDRDRQRTDMAAGPPTLRIDGKPFTLPTSSLAFVDGVVQRDSIYAYENRSGAVTKHWIVPITEAGWTRGQPIRAYLEFTAPIIASARNGETINLNQRGPQMVRVLVKVNVATLPSFAKGEFERNGVDCAPPCVLLQVLPGDGTYLLRR